jgi:adhesin/invasin
MRNKIWVLLIAFGLNLGLSIGLVFAEDKIPDWLKRVDYGVTLEGEEKPRIYLETVQPIYQSEDKINTIFTHDRFSFQTGRGTYSFGLGYRRLLLSESLLLGVNTFFDYQDLYKHYRQSVGLEALTSIAEARLNYYFGLSPKRIIEQTSASTIYEKAVDGLDAEFGAPIPYLPWLKIYGGLYYYDYEKFKNKEGWKLRGEIKPMDYLTINLETFDDNKSTREYRTDLRFNLAVVDFTPKRIHEALAIPKSPFPKTDLKEKTLCRVERNFNIEVETWKEAGSATVEIKRGDN